MLLVFWRRHQHGIESMPGATSIGWTLGILTDTAPIPVFNSRSGRCLPDDSLQPRFGARKMPMEGQELFEFCFTASKQSVSGTFSRVQPLVGGARAVPPAGLLARLS